MLYPISQDDPNQEQFEDGQEEDYAQCSACNGEQQPSEDINGHAITHAKLDWNTLLVYIGLGVGVVALILTIISVVIMFIDRERIKECLQNNMGSSSSDTPSALLY